MSDFTKSSRIANQVIYVEPNYMDDSTYPNTEDYCIVVDLIAEVPTRPREAATSVGNEIVGIRYTSNRGGASSVSFLQGTKFSDNESYLTTAPYEYTTYSQLDSKEQVTPEMIGIKSITLSYDTYQTPVVDINFVDVRGISLFQAEEMAHNTKGRVDVGSAAGSFFKCFFKQPYPKFTMYVKGFYGQPIALTLNCRDFRASFDSQTGNFNVKVSLIGYAYSFLADLTMSSLIAAPYETSFGKSYWENQLGNGNFSLANGEKMITLAELVSKMAKIKTELEEVVKENQTSTQEKTDRQNSLEANKNAINILIEEIKTENVNNIISGCIGDNDVLVSMEYNDDNKDKVKKYHNEVKKINDSLNSLNIVGIVDGYDENWFSDDYSEKDDVIEVFPDCKDVIEKSSFNNFYFIKATETIKAIDAELPKLSSEIAEEKEKEQETITKVTNENLGFQPTIANLFKIIFAHVDTYVHALANSAELANERKRTLEDLGLSSTDFSISDGDSVPAYPRTFRKVVSDGTTKIEDTWIGDVCRSSSIAPEIDFVNGMLDAVGAIEVKFNTKTDESKGGTEENNASTYHDNLIQLAQYKYAKIMYDNWISGLNSNEIDDVFSIGGGKSFFRYNVHIIDSFFNNVGQLANLNLETFVKRLVSSMENPSGTQQLISFLGDVSADCNFMLNMVPNFLDLTGSEQTSEIKLDTLFDPIPFNNIDWNRDVNKFPDMVFLYSSELSNKLNDSDSEFIGDSFNIADENDLPIAISSKNTSSIDYGYKIPAFGVSYGMGNQSYFTNIDVSMDNPVATEVSINAEYAIAASSLGESTDNESSAAENGNAALYLGQDLFTVFSNYAFRCSVTMLGCAYIQPLMYFQLNNIPLFNGAYLIYRVSHEITPGNMTTTFSGNRICSIQTPFVSKLVMATNQQYGAIYNSYGQIDPSRFASIDNSCPYKFFDPNMSNHSGPNLSSLLDQPFISVCAAQIKNVDENGAIWGEAKRGLEYMKRKRFDNLTAFYTSGKETKTLLLVLSAICYAAGGSLGGPNLELSVGLFATALYNRYFINGENFNKDIFTRSSTTEWLTKQAFEFILGDGIDSALCDKIIEVVRKVFTKSPAFLVGQTCNVYGRTDSLVVSGHNFKNQNDFRCVRNVTLTLADVKRITSYSNLNNNGWVHLLKEKNANSMQYSFICAIDVYGTPSDESLMVWACNRGDKEAPWKSTQVQPQTNEPKTKIKSLVSSISKTCNYSNTKIIFKKGKDGVFYVPNKDNVVYIACETNEQNARLFDVILQTYYPGFCQDICWVHLSDSSSYPDYIRIGIDTKKAIYEKKYQSLQTTEQRSVDIFNEDATGGNQYFYKAIGKLYSGGDKVTNSNLNNFKNTCINFKRSEITLDNIEKVLYGEELICDVPQNAPNSYSYSSFLLPQFSGVYPSYKHFNVKAACAEAQGGKPAYTSAHTKSSVYKIAPNAYHKGCTPTVAHFIDVGFKRASQPIYKGWDGKSGNGVEMRDRLMANHFYLVAGGYNIMNISNRNFTTVLRGYTPIPGDVCVTSGEHGGSCGHASMFNGTQWVSDALQLGPLVYRGDEERIWKYIGIFRYNGGRQD